VSTVRRGAATWRAHALADAAVAWVLGLTPAAARRKSGMASKHFWLSTCDTTFGNILSGGRFPSSQARAQVAVPPSDFRMRISLTPSSIERVYAFSSSPVTV
jgi:hypothetical protein